MLPRAAGHSIKTRTSGECVITRLTVADVIPFAAINRVAIV